MTLSKASRRSREIRRLSRRAGVGYPDLSTPSIALDPDLSPELIEATDQFYSLVRKVQQTDEKSTDMLPLMNKQEAEETAAAEHRRFINLII